MPAATRHQSQTVRQRRPSSSRDSAAEAVTEALDEKVKQPLLKLFHELEEWQQDNHFVLTGYRSASGSWSKSWASLGYLHNESVNIYSHLIGAIVFLVGSGALYQALRPRYEMADEKDIAVFACFFLGAVGCLGMSATFHTIANHSHAVASFGNKLDYLGIVSLIWGSFVPSIYYGFACRTELVWVYWGMITSIGMGCALVSVAERFRTPAYRPFRALMFVGMGLSAVFPVVHGVSVYGVDKMRLLIGLPWLVAQGALYIIGAAIYVARVPERLYPKTFDIWGSSHQVFHFLVVTAAIVHLVGLVKAFDFHHKGDLQGVCRA